MSTFKKTDKYDEPLSCPECGELTMVSRSDDCVMQDGALIPALDRLECSECGARLFGIESAGRILESSKAFGLNATTDAR